MRRLLSPFILALLVAGCGGDDIPTGNPMTEVRPDKFGEKVRGSVATGPENKKYWVRALVSGFENPEFGDFPAKVSPLPRAGGCEFPRPAQGAKIALVTVTDSDVRAPVYGIEPASVRERAEKFVKQWAKKGKDPGTDTETLKDVFHIANVVVTDNSAPVHLVLAGRGRVIWNVSTAEGVTISGVSVIDQLSLAGIANLPEGVPVHAMTGAQAENCKAIAYRFPAGWWPLAQDKDSVQQQILGMRHAAHAAFNRWFRGNFGMDSELVAVGSEAGSSFLVGPPPPPEARVAFRPLRGSDMKITPGAELVFAADKYTYRDKNDELVRAQAAQLAGGNLASLNK